MEKRVLLAVFLSFLVLYAYQALVPQPTPPVRPAPAGQAERAPADGPSLTPPDPAAAGSTEPSPAGASTEAPETPAAPAAAPLVADEREREIVVETNVVRAVFSNRGAVLTSWQLPRYLDEADAPVDLIPAELPASLPRPFALRLPGAGETRSASTGLYRASAAGDRIDGRRGPVDLVFEYEDADGLSVRKTFRLEPDSYVITFSAAAAKASSAFNPVVEWGPGLGDSIHVAGQSSTFGIYVQKPQAIVYADGDVERLSADAVSRQPTWEGTFPFAGIDDHYFISTLVRPGRVRLTFQPVTAPMPGSAQLEREMMSYNTLFAEPPRDARVYFGPKDFDVLQAVDQDLVRSIHYGIFSFLAVPLLRSLKWINAFVGNYGWSIILLTVVINVLMFPLRHRSVVSMRKMQELQPQVKAIQERYSKLKATDPARQKMNQEMMELYKQKGVNPASGCVPMLLTMPILFAFYSLLSVSVEIRGEPFVFWITDLSRHDPLYITPVLMGASMLWQQKLTPVADPAQARIMMIMPLMFLVFFLWAPSGLVIYWLVSNLLGIGQQYLTNRIAGKPVVRQVRPAAERKTKSVGAGQTDAARGK